MMTSIDELNNQMYNIKLRSSKLISMSDAKKQMVESSFRRRFHDLKYFKFRMFSYSLNSSYTLRHHHKIL